MDYYKLISFWSS